MTGPDRPRETASKYGAAPTATAGPSKEEERTLLAAYIRRLLTHRCLVICLWSAAFVACIPLAVISLQGVSMRLDPAWHTQTGRALLLFDSEFPSKAWLNYEVIMVTCDSCAAALDEPFAQTALTELSAGMESLQREDPQTMGDWDDHSEVMHMHAQLRGIAQSLGAPPPRNPYLSLDGRTVIFHTSWQYYKGIEDRTRGQLRKLRRLIAKLDQQGRRSGFRVYLAGPLSILNAMNDEMVKEIFLKEAIVAPLAMLVLIWQVGSVRLSCLAGMVMLVAICVAIGLLCIPMHFVSFSPVCPSISMVLCIALSVDYSLFTFTRFREELQAGKLPEDATEIAINSSCRVIALSGSILCLTFGFCILYPGEAVWCMALSGTIAAVVLVAVNMTLTPCLMASAPSFCAHGLSPDASGIDSRGSRAWFKMGAFMTRGWCPLLTMGLIYVCMAPMISQLATYLPINSIQLQTPRGSPSYSALAHAKASIPVGELAPITVIVKGSQGDVRSDATFARGCEQIHRLVSATKGTVYELSPEDFTSPFAVSGAMVGLLGRAPGGGCPPMTCLRWDRPPPECPLMPSAKQMLTGGSPASTLMPGTHEYYQRLWRGLVNRGNSSATVRVLTPFPQSGHFVAPFHQALVGAGTDGFYSPWLAVQEDSDACFQRMPLVMGLTLLSMSLLVGITFGTFLAPVKLILTVVAPVAFSFGILVCVFQHGALGWTHWRAFEPIGVFWVVPVVCPAVLLGLAVDYDIFLFVRVVELREAGFDNAAAIVGALSATGPVITSAGLIMSLAFAGMLLSTVSLNCQFGFIIAVGVLIDTFIVRSFLVPCVLSVGGFMNYWPAGMPEPTRTLEDVEEYLFEKGGAGRALNRPEARGTPKLLA